MAKPRRRRALLGFTPEEREGLASVGERGEGPHATSITASISTVILKGSEAIPTAQRAWRPRSPNTSTNRSIPASTSGTLAITSPVARALIGKAKGASVEVVTPGGAKAYEVKKVEWR